MKQKNNVLMYIVFGITFLIGIIFFVVPPMVKKPSFTKEIPDSTLGFTKRDDFHMEKYSPRHDLTLQDLKKGFDKRIYFGISGIIILLGVSLYSTYLIKKKNKKQ
ncbi:hypothetical protein KsCSTR_19880 [Candidatus Kuenenia stuttgartiensis]|jgi:hypothetical protein|uniref:PDGLE domain-containing protein n=2 Tax=Kuenenia stuttgartiensis TaxID=174633 RepID=A0A2C9CB98_KUEST|nr:MULTISPECIES: hypothetical protein [Kuenenia]MBE7548866.1 hypothetical protein [Planctomycetia bacterium]MBW7942300.1 hypothetical protein [Candidatus Kuenenia stuttgartiensis]MBZ0191650.1 hypothetical protein [Candidatus Kuenenia stuttgartiensis]MCF6151928.1 hypothetical protein [Candidatus Kuenenia stuttgartiensis]MCL4726075.1 hypothetical protein [Candidatus Kuenenia stuttgartiensis]